MSVLLGVMYKDDIWVFRDKYMSIYCHLSFSLAFGGVGDDCNRDTNLYIQYIIKANDSTVSYI